MDLPNLKHMQFDVNTAEMAYNRCISDWETLSDVDKAAAKLSNAEVHKRYQIAKKYGKQTFNVLSNGGTHDIKW